MRAPSEPRGLSPRSPRAGINPAARFLAFVIRRSTFASHPSLPHEPPAEAAGAVNGVPAAAGSVGRMASFAATVWHGSFLHLALDTKFGRLASS